MSKHSNRIAFIALIGLLAVAPAFAADKKTEFGDTKFLKDAAEAGMAEVQLGQLATQKASNPGVKTFGQHMVDDHTKAGDQLKQLATQKGVELPQDPSMLQKHDIDKISKLSGAEFDKAFMDQMVKDHKKVVAEFQHVSKGAKDADVKSWAAKTLPTLEAHLKDATALDLKVGGKQATK